MTEHEPSLQSTLHQQRMVFEEFVLTSRADKLKAALDNEHTKARVGEDEFARMDEQFRHMVAYLNVLRRRIAVWKKES
jgi:hypothetical protein